MTTVYLAYFIPITYSIHTIYFIPITYLVTVILDLALDMFC